MSGRDRLFLTVPASVVGRWRAGLLAEIARVGEVLQATCATPGAAERRECWRGQLHRLDRVWGLLDAFGWPPAERPVEVDLLASGDLLVEVFGREVERATQMARGALEGREQDPDRAGRALAELKQVTEFGAVVQGRVEEARSEHVRSAERLRQQPAEVVRQGTVVAVLLLDEGHQRPWWTRAEIDAKVVAEPADIDRALGDLEDAGAVIRDDDGRLRASDAVVRLGVLGVISI